MDVSSCSRIADIRFLLPKVGRIQGLNFETNSRSTGPVRECKYRVTALMRKRVYRWIPAEFSCLVGFRVLLQTSVSLIRGLKTGPLVTADFKVITGNQPHTRPQLNC